METLDPSLSTREEPLFLSTATNCIPAADPFTAIKRLIAVEQLEIDELRSKASDAKPPPSRSSESEAKDLLKKVKFIGKHFKFKNMCQLRHIWGIITDEKTLPSYDAPKVETFHYEDRVNVTKSYLQTCPSNEVFELIRSGASRNSSANKKQSFLILISLPDVGPDNYNTFMNHLKPIPDHKVTLTTLISAPLNEEEKRKERGHYRRHARDDYQNRGNPFCSKDLGHPSHSKRGYGEKDPSALEVNVLHTRTKPQPPRSTIVEKWFFICRKRGDLVAQDHPNFDPDHRSKRRKKEQRTYLNACPGAKTAPIPATSTETTPPRTL
ncbi:hypothetical protein DYB36_002605 [Aphanomyces astaci]|uniref:Uncharacterized protein n=1 Tax=Aphanomyces astaci TaxID=112090 RepID=A0A397BB23_APHAT|nr:hypothetical protein DYB36_002605 [Aphanomyces astaci]